MTPHEVVLNFAERDEVVSTFVSTINTLLEIEETEKYSYSYKLGFEVPITREQEALIKKVFNIYGWCVEINSKFSSEDNNYIINVVLTPKK